MPTENSLPFEEHEFYAETDDGWTRIGKMNEIPEITICPNDIEYNGIPLNNITKGFIGTIEFQLFKQKLTKKKLRIYRNVFGIDLLPIRFPKKKNRRKKRRYRRSKKIFNLIFGIKE